MPQKLIIFNTCHVPHQENGSLFSLFITFDSKIEYLSDMMIKIPPI